MPLSLSTAYATYVERADQGALASLVDGLPCPRPGCGGKLVLTGMRVRRGVVWVAGAELVADDVEVWLARCCGRSRRHWCRVLPADLRPHATFSAQAQEAAIESYARGEGGLRRAVSRLTGCAPHFTTLHGWIGGLGSYALGRHTPPGVLPMSAALVEASRRVATVQAAWDQIVAVDPTRHRSERRRDEIEACHHLLAAAAALVPDLPSPLAEWSRLTIAWCGVAGIRGWARSPSTPIQHHILQGLPLHFPPTEPPSEGSSPPCPIRTRSPPGDSR